MAALDVAEDPPAEMHPVPPEQPDRRQAERCGPVGGRYRAEALVRPGQEVVVVNLSRGGALVESAGPLRPGRTTELHLSAPPHPRTAITGRVDRSHVSSLTPLRYRSAIVFDRPIELP